MNQGLVPAKLAALTPRAEAIVDVPNSRRMTYAEFDSLVRRAANGLRGLGLEKGDRFAVLSRNCAEYMTLYYAAGRAGLIGRQDLDGPGSQLVSPGTHRLHEAEHAG